MRDLITKTNIIRRVKAPAPRARAVEVTNGVTQKREIQVVGYPTECPLCHVPIDPEKVFNWLNPLKEEHLLFLVLRCPRPECKRIFMAVCRPHHIEYNAERTYHHYVEVLAPRRPRRQEFGRHVQKVSPVFIGIYNEALAAEEAKLLQICGPGYRKALEFLLKDYLIAKHPDKEQEIRASTSLAKIIKDYVDDERLKACAQRAAWLGNDEVHYDRRWVEKDVQDFKAVIRLTTGWLNQVLDTEELLADMAEGR